MNTLRFLPQGRFGNQATQYLFAKGWAYRNNYILTSDPWVGEQIFQLNDPRPPADVVGIRCDENRLCGLAANGVDVEFRGYAQNQQCANYYTQRGARDWLRFRPEIAAACAQAIAAYQRGVPDVIVCHRRVGDYTGYGYPVVSLRSYWLACEEFGLDHKAPTTTVLTEEVPTPHTGFVPDDISFVVDFYRMVTAKTLLRGNSTFSWLAALLGDGLVLSPIIDGLEGGREHDCQFVPGNWPRLANFDFVSDMHVKP